MKQPKIKYNTECPCISDHMFQVANHWNIARGWCDKLTSALFKAHDTDRVMDYDLYRDLSYLADNIRVGLHNLGQMLVKIDAFDYDWDGVELRDWECKEKSIYNVERKTTALVSTTSMQRTDGYVARDKDGALHLFRGLPVHRIPRYAEPEDYLAPKECWSDGGFRPDGMVIPDRLFPGLKWEDEPIKVDMFLRKSE